MGVEALQMTDTNNATLTEVWSKAQVYGLTFLCLLIGITGGWFLRGARTTAKVPITDPAAISSSTPPRQTFTPKQMEQIAQNESAPLLEKLATDPKNPQLLANIGNIFYDAKQYLTAILYYRRSLEIAPRNASVHTDLGSAMWYMGNADGAIEQFQQALTYEPNKANALFNLGMVKWRGKLDAKGAVAAWQKLLDTNPNYTAKGEVRQLIAQAKKHI
jgi:cytochrome c-type biogenesis protein CcmH/NrfG